MIANLMRMVKAITVGTSAIVETFTPTFSSFPYTGSATGSAPKGSTWAYGQSGGGNGSATISLGTAVVASDNDEDGYITITFTSQSAGTLDFYLDYSFTLDSAPGFEVSLNGVSKYIRVTNTSGQIHVTGISYAAGTNVWKFNVYGADDGSTAIIDNITWTAN